MTDTAASASAKPATPSWPHRLWGHRWFVLAVVVLAALGAWQTTRLILGPDVAVDPVVRGNLIQTVVASGHVETAYRVEIGSTITGMVSDVLVEEGQQVKLGQTLVAIEATQLTAAVVDATGALAQAQARLRQLRELTLPAARQELAQVQAMQVNAQQVYDRAAALAKSGYATRASLDEARKNLDVARTQVRAAQLQVYTSGAEGSDQVIAETQSKQAQANLDAARSRLGYATIVAPRDGVLISRNVERGAVVQAGKVLMVLAPAGDAQLVLQIDEKNLRLIALGQGAKASADAFPDQTFAASITYINPGIDILRASVEVKLTVPEPPAYLRQDMTVSIDIEVGRRDATLILPLRDVHDVLTTAPWALVAENGHARRRTLRLGLRASTHVEIIDGIKEGEQAVPVTADIADGQRIRAVAP